MTNVYHLPSLVTLQKELVFMMMRRLAEDKTRKITLDLIVVLYPDPLTVTARYLVTSRQSGMAVEQRFDLLHKALASFEGNEIKSQEDDNDE